MRSDDADDGTDNTRNEYTPDAPACLQESGTLQQFEVTCSACITSNCSTEVLKLSNESTVQELAQSIVNGELPKIEAAADVKKGAKITWTMDLGTTTFEGEFTPADRSDAGNDAGNYRRLLKDAFFSQLPRGDTDRCFAFTWHLIDPSVAAGFITDDSGEYAAHSQTLYCCCLSVWR